MLNVVIFILGDYFAGGQSVNAFQPQVGKVGVKQRSKDADALAKLGVVTVPRAESRLQHNPKMKFKVDMPMNERKAVKSIAKRKNFTLKLIIEINVTINK